MLTDGEQPTMMTVREVAGYLRVHEMTIYRMARRGEIPAYKLGSRWRFNRHRIEEWSPVRWGREQNRLMPAGCDLCLL